MSGINLDKTDLIITKDSTYLESITSISKRLKPLISDLSDEYSGSTFNYLSARIKKQITNVDSINSLMKSYLSLLGSVKKSYVVQEQTFAQQIKNKL